LKRTILAICSDLHGGHRHGLLNPETLLDEIDEKGNVIEQYHPPLNKIQEYLWEKYTGWISEAFDYAKRDEVVFVLNGDLTAGNKYKQLLVSDRLADQIIIGEANAAPIYARKPKAVRLIKGTGAHVFDNGSAEILIATLLKADYPKISTRVYDHALMEIGGVDVDISHHGPPTGPREWLKGNEARYYLRSLMLQEIVAGNIPPRLIFRGHYHEYIEEVLKIKHNGEWYASTLVITPSLTFITDYARMVMRSPNRVTHGIVLAEIVDGELLRVVPMLKTVDIRSKESL
jgi:hypothetical protein